MKEVLQLQPKLEAYKNQGLEIIILTFGDRFDNEDFFRKNNINATIIYDSNYQIVNEYKVSSIPANFYISKEGRLIDTSVGWTSKSMVLIENFIKTGQTIE